MSKVEEILLREKTIVGRVEWLIRLRWLAVLGLIVTLLVVERILPVHFTSVAMWVLVAVVGLIASYNLLLGGWLRGIRRLAMEHPEQAIRKARKLAMVQIVSDLVCLTVILNYAGGLINPLRIFMVFHVAIAGIMLTRKEAFSIATLASLLLIIMSVAGAVHPSICLRLEGFPLDQRLTGDWFYILSICGAMTFAFFLIAYFTSDISIQLQEAYKSLAGANRALQERDAAKSRFMRVLAHQLRTPLAAIISLIHVFGQPKHRQSSEKQQEPLQRIHRRCYAMMDMVDDLLRLTKIQEGLDLKKVTKPTELTEVISETLKLYEAQSREKGLNWQVELASMPVFMFASERDISDLVGNLVSNAIQYTEPPGKISITSTVSNDNYLLKISDSGMGIPEAAQAHVFEEFFRADNARKAEANSSGLGLNIVRAMVKQLGGEIRFQSKENQGTTFLVTLPTTKRQTDPSAPDK